MRKVFVTASFFLINSLSAQKIFINAAAGLAIYSGDLQQGNFAIKLPNTAFGGGIGYKITPHLFANVNFLFANVSASDSNVADNLIKKRNLSFHTNIQEASLQIEYDLFELTHSNQFTPYFFAGIGIYHFNPFAYDRTNKKTFLQALGTEGQGLPQYPDRKFYKLSQPNIPFGVGVKYSLSQNLTMGLEFSFRKLFTDYLDDVSTTYPDSLTLFNARGLQAVDLSFRGNELNPPRAYTSGGNRGNPDKNDAYNFVLFRLTYGLPQIGFGSSGSGSSSKTKNQMNCPKKVL